MDASIYVKMRGCAVVSYTLRFDTFSSNAASTWGKRQVFEGSIYAMRVHLRKNADKRVACYMDASIYAKMRRCAVVSYTLRFDTFSSNAASTCGEGQVR